MLNKIKEFMSWLGFKGSGVGAINPIRTSQEDPRQLQAIKRTRKHIEDSQDIIMARALKPHAYDCEDTVTCKKEICWKFIPDKIVSKPYIIKDIIVDAKDAQENKEIKVKRAARSRRKVDINQGEKG